ncbi:MAG: MBL fold metallo-hydrolase [Chlamydiota bacterium]
MHGKFLFLGTGGSLGIPIVACTCSVCSSSNPRNKRLRPSGVISVAGKHLLIDAGPDFRTQALRAHLKHLDGILLTHCHFDHIGGLDDLRVFSFAQKKKLPCLLSQESYDELQIRYHYLMHPHSTDKFKFQILKSDFGRIDFEGVDVQYMSYFQAGMKVSGYRIGTFAYVSDIREYSEEVVRALEGVETLVLSALRYTPTEVHFSLNEAVNFARSIKAKKTWLTHLAHDLEHDKVNQELPSDISLSYDGLEIEF